jgi:hypothetical protein
MLYKVVGEERVLLEKASYDPYAEEEEEEDDDDDDEAAETLTSSNSTWVERLKEQKSIDFVLMDPTNTTVKARLSAVLHFLCLFLQLSTFVCPVCFAFGEPGYWNLRSCCRFPEKLVRD